MVLVEAQHHRSLQVLDKEKYMVKLGRDLFGSHRLTERAFRDGLDAVRKCAKLAEGAGANQVLTVATSATREARNGSLFLRAVQRETGLRPRVISGTEEGHLIFRAVRDAIEITEQDVLVLDIGGGSVEVVVGNRDRIQLAETMRLGVQRLLDKQPNASALSSQQHHELRGYIHGVASSVIAEAQKLEPSRIIGTSGTIKTLCETAHLNNGGEEWRTSNAQKVTLEELKRLSKVLTSKDESERRDIDGIDPERTDTIHLGSVLLVEILSLLQHEELTICEASLREGVILDHLARHRLLYDVSTTGSVRRAKVVELARRYERDDPHERHVARIALQIFDETAEVHALGAFAREILEYAALLHDIGQQISFRKRHKHSLYIIRNSELSGFTDEEIELLALVARYHRRAQPTKKHKSFKKLSGFQRSLVRVLSSILRVAKGLDRGQNQLVKKVHCHVTQKNVQILVHGAGDLELELGAARRRTSSLEKALRRTLEIEHSS